MDQDLYQAFSFDLYFMYYLQGYREVKTHKNKFWNTVWLLLAVALQSLWNLVKPVSDFHTVLNETASEPDRKIYQYVFEWYFETCPT